MHWLSWLGMVNLIEVLNYYLILGFVVSMAIRFRSYRAVLGMVFASRNRWPKLLEVANKHRTIFLGWPMLLVVGLTFTLMLGNSLAIHFVWVQAKVTFADLGGHWPALAAVILSGGIMLFLDTKATITAGQFDRIALEKDLDKAESWLKSWMSPALRVVSFGFLNPRQIVGAEVERALVEANWVMIGGMGRASLLVGMQLAFGLSLWLAWALCLRHTA